MDTVEAILEELAIAGPARAVYLSLLSLGEASATVLAKRTGITRTSIYDQLRDLRNRGLVVERDTEGKTLFGASDVRSLEQLLDERIERLSIGRDLLHKQLPTLLRDSYTVQPQIRFFEGSEGVREMLKDMLWYENITVRMCFPYRTMREVLGEEYLAWFNTRRVRDHIALRTIWGHDERNMEHIFAGADEFVERRYAREDQQFTMAYALYEDRVVYISSQAESYGFLVQSREYAALMQVHFDVLWAQALKR